MGAFRGAEWRVVRGKSLIFLVLATALMGSSFAVGQMTLHYAPPLFLAGLRFTLAGLLLAAGVRHRPHPHDWRLWARVAVIGLLQTAGVMGAIFLSLVTIPAGESAILTFANPMLVVVLGAVFLGQRYRSTQWLGAALGIVGIAVAIGGSLHLQIGVLYGLASAVFWAVATVLMKRWGGSVDPWVLTAYQMLIGGLVLLVVGGLQEGPIFHVTLASAGLLAWLVVMASIVQFGLWFYVLHHEDSAQASSYLFLAPVFGVLTGWALLNQAIGVHVLIGALFIIGAIWLVNRSSSLPPEQRLLPET